MCGSRPSRNRYTLDGMSGPLSVADGKIQFKEEDGLDYAPTTVQLPGGERVPFLFTVKELVAKGSGPDFKPGLAMSGKFTVCTLLANTMMEQGYTAELGFQQFLYPDDKEVRPLLSPANRC